MGRPVECFNIFCVYRLITLSKAVRSGEGKVTKAAKKQKLPKINYIVRWNGAVVGTISNSKERYTRAIIGQIDEKIVREWVYVTPDQDEQYRSTFDHYARIAAEDPKTGAQRSVTPELVYASHKLANSRIAGGFDAFAEQWRQRRIDWFEGARTGGFFDVRVLKWLTPGENQTEPRNGGVRIYPNSRSKFPEVHAEESYREIFENKYFPYDWTKVVPVETETTIPVAQRFAKMSKKAQRELLGLVCDKMIQQQSWDEIAILLSTYLEGDASLVLKLMGRA
jgi:hypothetical protein